MFLFFKQKTAYEMRISYWSSDVCSSDLIGIEAHCQCARATRHALQVCIEAKYRAASTAGITADAFEHAGAIMHLVTGERRMQACGTGDFAIEPLLQRHRCGWRSTRFEPGGRGRSAERRVGKGGVS